MYAKRTLEYFFKTASKQFPVLLVTGPRQVGKTTFLRNLSSSKRTYVTLDDPLNLKLAKGDPALFMARYPPPLLIDEVQYAPELLPYIKMAVDIEQKPNMFWLTGSQQFHLMQGISESLAGRVGILNLLGLSYKETIGQGPHSLPFLPTSQLFKKNITEKYSSLKEIYSSIWRGSFPNIALNKKRDHHLFYSSYVQTYLQRDVRSLTKVGDEMSFLRFLRATAARTGQMLNLSDFARDADIAPNTAKSWLSILQTSGMIYFLQPYHNNITKRLVKTPKLYFLDTGLCSYLTEWTSPETLEAGAMSGAILETWIITELLKSYWHNGREAPFYYYRDKDQKEIDLIILQNRTIYPLEIKKTASPTKDDVRHFTVLEKLKLPIEIGGVICLAKQSLPLNETSYSIPISLI